MIRRGYNGRMYRARFYTMYARMAYDVVRGSYFASYRLVQHDNSLVWC